MYFLQSLAWFYVHDPLFKTFADTTCHRGSDLRTYKFFFQSRGYTVIKSALSSLRQILPIESPLKMMKNAFHFTLKVFFFVEIFKLLS